MTSRLCSVLRVLQEISHLHVLRDVALVFAPVGTAHEVGAAFDPRISRSRDELRRLCSGATASELESFRIERALFLRMLLASAGVRLARWKSQAEWQPLQRSQMLESLANDAERRELALIEKSMDAVRFADYICKAAQRSSV